ncbi:hypothetical protein ABEB36_001868 [Hypothenemus hampei]|uniref:Large ribosomal subunit protein mL38 n=1 Tax=Hypothenemus hampei TaxID=57062 RepID=A0ABD1FGM5_HYPHA
MSTCLLNVFKLTLNECSGSNFGPLVRHGHHLRGKPPGIAKSLKEKLSAANYKNPSIHYEVDIGLPPTRSSNKTLLQERITHVKAQRANPELEKLSRERKLLIDLDKSQQDWFATIGPKQIRQIAKHYGVFEHLFGDAYFEPQVPLRISYISGNLVHPVYFGNFLRPDDAQTKPQVTFDSDKDSLWSLVLTNPDGHFTDNEKEYVHWFVANIPGNTVANGETIVEYLQPFPPKGTGYHRFVFILYKQEKKLDLSKYCVNNSKQLLEARTFKTYDFYREMQDSITPAGLAFFQSDWSPSLKAFYHNVLEMKEPIYEYDFPPAYIRPQEWFPKKKPFNLYMDKYRDPKEINKEFLLRKLKNVHPFKAPPPVDPYPHVHKIDKSVPSWLQLEIQKSRLKWGRINDIE